MSKNILVLAAHPDDETIGCGATLAKLSDEGNNIHLMTFTDGVDSRDERGAENRNNKLEEISKLLANTDIIKNSLADPKATEEKINEEIDVFFGDISCVTNDKCLQ